MKCVGEHMKYISIVLFCMVVTGVSVTVGCTLADIICGDKTKRGGTTVMKMPRKIKKAIETLSGYCDKHKTCEGCPLDGFCENIKSRVLCDWANWEE